MDIQTYITSGVLELCVFSQLPPAEMQEVAQMREKYPEVAEEIARIETLIEKLAFDFEKKPKKELKNKILERIENIEKKTKPNANSISLISPWKYQVTVAASVFLFSTTLVLGYLLWQKTEQQQQLWADTQQKVEQVQQELAIAKNPKYRHIPLTSTDSSKSQAALVFWNPQSQEVYVEMGLLPSLPSDKQYQLWAIIDGKPSDMGVFDTVGHLQKMKVAKDAQAFAVTIEPKGGSKVPTLTAMVVLGKV
ncbi:MAG: anti-sigma factor domain-containing protein [Bacteroidia bacterium]